MPPMEIRQEAGAYEQAHCNGDINLKLLLAEAFIAGYHTKIKINKEMEMKMEAPSYPGQSFFLDDNPISSFEDFWRQYDYKKAKPQALKMWKRLSLAQQREVMDAIPAYIASTPDKSYRMHPATFLNPVNERWKDEIINKTIPINEQQQRLNSYANLIASVTGKEN